MSPNGAFFVRQPDHDSQATLSSAQHGVFTGQHPYGAFAPKLPSQ